MTKRIPRELKHDIGKYIALSLFLTVMIGFTSGFIVGDESLKARYDSSFDEFKVEDGHFVLENEATPEMLEKVRRTGVEVYPLFYKEEAITFGSSRTGSDEADNAVSYGNPDSGDKTQKSEPATGTETARIYVERDEVNLADYWEGRGPEAPDEIAVDRLYMSNNGLKVGDTITAAGQEYTITGAVALSDFSALFKNNADTMFDATDFTVAVVTREGFDRMRNSGLHYCYAWRNNDQSLDKQKRHDLEEDVSDALVDAAIDELMLDPDAGDMFSAWTKDIDAEIAAIKDKEGGYSGDSSLMDSVFKARNGIEDLVPRSGNQAIKFTGDDLGKDRVMIVTLLYIVIVIMAFVFGITVKSTIEKEAKAIGTLRASGYTRGEMLRHYVTLPLMLTLLAAVAGNVMGYTFMKKLCADMYLQSYSLLPYKTVWSMEAFFETTFIPLVIIFIVVVLVIAKELMLAPLKFLRGDLRSSERSHAIRLRAGSFITRFRTRVLLQNLPSYIVMFVGILFSVIIMIFCIGMYPLLEHYEELIMDSAMAEYQYVLKEPYEITTGTSGSTGDAGSQEGGTENAGPAGSQKSGAGETTGTQPKPPEKYQLTSVKNDDKRKEDITVYGIRQDSVYLTDLDIPDGENEVVVSSAYAKKYRLKVGSKFRVKEEFKKERHTFKVASIYDYEAQLCIFMRFSEFNRVFDRDRGEYAGYLSDTKLDEIPESKIATVITKEDYATISKQLDSSMGGIFELFSIFGVVIFVIVIYLLSRVLIEKNARSIAMVKILGYSDAEISSIYNHTTTLVVFVSLIACLPIAYFVFAWVFVIIMDFFTGWLTYYIAPIVYVKIVLIGMASYMLIHVFQMRRIRKVPMGEVLKGME